MTEPLYRFKPSVLEYSITLLVEELIELEDCVIVDTGRCNEVKKEIKSTLIQFLLRQTLYHKNIIEYCIEFLSVKDLDKIKSHDYNYNKILLIIGNKTTK